MFLGVGTANAVVYTVGAGGAFATVNAAIATVTPGAGDSVSIISNFTDNTPTTFAGSFPASVLGPSNGAVGGGVTWTTNGSAAGIRFINTLTSPVVFKNVSMTQTTVGNATFNWSAVGIGSSVYFENCVLANAVNTTVFRANSILTTTNQLSFYRCKFTNSVMTVAGSSSLLSVGALIISTNVIDFRDCLFIGGGDGFGFNNDTSVHTSSIVKIQNCTFANMGTAYASKAVGTLKNNIFSGNTATLSLTSPATTADFDYNASTNAVDFGTHAVTITAARTFCDTNNYYISPASLTLNAGVSIDGVTGVDIGLNGVKQGANNILGLGCNPYSLALCGGYSVGR
jgi:hypothetical protein